MLHINPEINDINNPREIYDAVQAALLSLPRFPDLTLQAVVVISDTCMTSIMHLRHPADDNSQRDLMTFMFDTLTRLGLHSFAEDDTGPLQQVEADKMLIELLLSHPDAHVIGGVTRQEALGRMSVREAVAARRVLIEQFGSLAEAHSHGETAAPHLHLRCRAIVEPGRGCNNWVHAAEDVGMSNGGPVAMCWEHRALTPVSCV